MLDKIFKFLTNSARKIAEKGMPSMSRNKIFVVLIIGITLVRGITTYNGGECLDCDVMTEKEAYEMINNHTLLEDMSKSEIAEWYKTRTYVPFTSVGTFLLTWLKNIVVPVVLLSFIFFLIYFMWNLIKFMFLNFKNKNIMKVLTGFQNPSKINKK